MHRIAPHSKLLVEVVGFGQSAVSDQLRWPGKAGIALACRLSRTVTWLTWMSNAERD